MNAEEHDVKPVTLRTARLTLRPWRAADVMPFAELNADQRVMEFFPRLLEPRESETMAAKLKTHIESNGYGLWAVEIPNEAAFVGYIGLNAVPPDMPFAPAVEIGWRLAFAAWGQGLATEGARAVLSFAHARLQLDEVVSITSTLNVRSRRVMEKIGMLHDRGNDFDHPRISAGHRLRRHVLYRHNSVQSKHVGDDGLEPPTLSV